MKRWKHLLRWLVRRAADDDAARIEREIDEELSFHLDMRTRENLAAGMPPDEARRQAARRLGALEDVKRDASLIRRGSRGSLPARLAGDVLMDLRIAARTMASTPALSLTAVLALGLGIGATTAVFSVIDGVMLQELPYAGGAEDVVIIRSNGLQRDSYALWEEELDGIEALGFYTVSGHELTGSAEPVRVSSMPVSAGFFTVLGVDAAHGRTLVRSDHEPGAEPVVVIGDRLWRTSFGADPTLIGRQVFLDGQPFTVAGVMPPGFKYLYYYSQSAVWVPMHQVTAYGGLAIARVAPDATIEQVRAEVATLEARLEVEPLRQGQTSVAWLRDAVMENDRPSLQLLAGAVALVLLIACANVANLLLARAFARRGEIAMRVALGAGPGRITRQLLTESGLLAFLGGALGVALAWATLPAILAISPTYLPRQENIAIDLRVLLFALLICGVTGVLFGLAPVLFARSGALRTGRGGESSDATPGGRRTLRALVIAEVAFALVLVVGTGLLVRTFLHLNPSAPGFDPEAKLTFELRLPEHRYPDPQDAAAFFDTALEEFRTIAGVADAAGISNLPMVQMAYVTEAIPEGAAPDDRLPRLWYERATGNYLEVMKIPLLRGQSLEHAHATGLAPMVASQTAARALFPDADPLGKRVSVQLFDGAREFVIVGVAADTRRDGVRTAPRATVWVRHTDHPDTRMTFVLQARGDPTELVTPARETIRALDPDLPLDDVRTMRSILFDSVSLQRFYTLLMSAFGLIALALAAIGFYGVMSFSVGRRRRELGVRLALGAAPGSLLSLVMRDGLVSVTAGVALGLLGAFGFTRLLESRIFGVQTLTPLDFGLLTLLVVAVGLAATFVPARRAMRADPVDTLRQT